jgi:hypothetical protein
MLKTVKQIIERICRYRHARQPAWQQNRSRINDLVEKSSRHTKLLKPKRVAFLNIRGWPLQVSTDALAIALLQKHGHSVSLLSCEESLPFCMYGPVTRPIEEQRDCSSCCAVKSSVFSSVEQETLWPRTMNLPQKISREIQNLSSIKECTEFSWKNYHYGSQVYPSIAWFLRRSKLGEGDLQLYKSAISAAARSSIALEEFLNRKQVDTFVLFNGDFTPESTAAAVLKSKGVRFVSHDYTFEERLGVALNASVWDDLTFDGKDPAWRRSIDASMTSAADTLIAEWKRKGGYQGQLFWDASTMATQQDVRLKVGLDDRPIAVAFTNLTYESSVIGKERAFKSQFHWIDQLLKWFSENPQFQLVVRCHPAEERTDHWRPQETITDHLRANHAHLAENIKIVNPSNKLSSYSLGNLANIILVYSSTIGLEFAEDRKTTLTAAHVHYGDRGFTIDPPDSSAYFSVLHEQLSGRGDNFPHGSVLARDYIAWLLFKRTLLIEGIANMEDYWPSINARRLSDLDKKCAPNLHNWVQLMTCGQKWW